MPTKQKFKTWDQYVHEAQKPPWKLPVDDDTTIVVEAPTGEQVIEAQRLFAAGDGDVEKQLRLVCGEEAAEQLLPLLKVAPAGAMNAVLDDIMQHFGFSSGEAPTPT